MPEEEKTEEQTQEVAAESETPESSEAEAAATAEGASTEPEVAEESSGEETPELPDFSNMLAEAAASSIDMLNDVELDVKIELGRAELTVEDVLQLSEGSVVELNKLAGDPVDVLVNEQLIARGEILVVNDNFCVRLNEIVPGVSERVNEE
ncbi:MAG: flagellar motor switch protein FliN [Planctomycetes bacterium]|nr:flagellar motor switch protein FliN [Planctomycetota bacterium]